MRTCREHYSAVEDNASHDRRADLGGLKILLDWYDGALRLLVAVTHMHANDTRCTQPLSHQQRGQLDHAITSALAAPRVIQAEGARFRCQRASSYFIRLEKVPGTASLSNLLLLRRNVTPACVKRWAAASKRAHLTSCERHHKAPRLANSGGTHNLRTNRRHQHVTIMRGKQRIIEGTFAASNAPTATWHIHEPRTCYLRGSKTGPVA